MSDSQIPAQSRPPEEVRRLIILLVGLVMSLMIGGMLAVIIYLRAEAMDKAAASTRGVARLLDEHIGRILSSSDAALIRAGRISAQRLAGKITHDDELRAFQDLSSMLPERAAVLSTDEKGLVVAATAGPEAAVGMDMNVRPWFRALAAGSQVVVGPMFRNRLSNRLIFTISRRINKDDGEFGGMVSIGIDIDIFTDYHKSLVLGQNGFVSAAVKGELVLRQPNPESFVGKSVKGGPVAEAAAAEPSGTIRFHSVLDGIDRIVSYRVVPDYGVVVSAGMATDDVLNPWGRTALALSGAIVLICAGLVGVSAMAFRALDREEAIADGLEARVRERTALAEMRAEEAKAANESKTRFLAAASHDLRQPLQAAGMFAEVLASDPRDPGQSKVIDKLRQSIEGTNSLLTTLLDVSTLEAGKIKPTISAFRLMPLLTKLAEQMEPEASAKGLSIGAIPTSAVVSSDPVLLERLLRNLLVNAVRYTDCGGIRIGCRHRGDKVAIQVWDTGIGIPTDKVQAVFEDFTRLETSGNGAKGLGLGLGVVRRMARLLGHALELRSIPGRGSCFGVVVPRG